MQSSACRSREKVHYIDDESFFQILVSAGRLTRASRQEQIAISTK